MGERRSALVAWIAAAGLLVLGACRSANVPPPVGTTAEAILSASRDTAVLPAVIRALQLQQELPTRGIRIVVDPRPLLDGGGFPPISSGTFASIPSTVLESRAAALRSAGVEPGDAAAPQRNCGGALLPAPQPGEPDLKQGCPAEELITIAVSLPRAGSAKLPPGEPYDRLSLQAAEGYWTVRVARALVGPGGKSLQYYDVIMRKDGRNWVYVMLLPLVIWE